MFEIGSSLRRLKHYVGGLVPLPPRRVSCGVVIKLAVIAANPAAAGTLKSFSYASPALGA